MGFPACASSFLRRDLPPGGRAFFDIDSWFQIRSNRESQRLHDPRREPWRSHERNAGDLTQPFKFRGTVRRAFTSQAFRARTSRRGSRSSVVKHFLRQACRLSPSHLPSLRLTHDEWTAHSCSCSSSPTSPSDSAKPDSAGSSQVPCTESAINRRLTCQRDDGYLDSGRFAHNEVWLDNISARHQDHHGGPKYNNQKACDQKSSFEKYRIGLNGERHLLHNHALRRLV